ncbi:MAG TPA: C25 family peptidase propeptide domain-containing protein, partial [Lentimicrobium sp.]|nr:C25 family peptidase propeptide domain-containing protein [Lentimicrobium sp.]
MKKALLFIAISFATVALLLTGNVSTAQVVLKQNGKTGISVEQTDFAGMRVKSTLSSLNNLEVNTDKGLFTEISANGYSYAVEEGYPKLPVMRKLIEVPVGASIEIDVVSYDVREYNLNDLGINSRIIPAQAPVAKNQTEEIPLLINNKVYGSNSFYGKELASAEILGFMRGTRMARLDISPVEYNPVSGVIRVYD